MCVPTPQPYRCIGTKGQCCPGANDPMCGINLNARRPGKPSRMGRRGVWETALHTPATAALSHKTELS